MKQLLKNILVLAFTLFFYPLMHAGAVNMKVKNSTIIAKGILKIVTSTIIGIQTVRFVINHHLLKDREAMATAAILTIPNLHFFISGCTDIHEGVQSLKTERQIFGRR